MDRIAFNKWVQTNDIFITDGATGTNLMMRGLKRNDTAEQFVLTNPKIIGQLHKDFINAGSEIVLTCSFGGNSIRLMQSGLSDQIVEVNSLAVQLAKQACANRDVKIAGSMGPLGQMLKPYGLLDYDEALQAYGKQAKILSDAGIDFLLIETQFDINEAKAAIEGAQKNSNCAIICSFSFDRGIKTMMGISPSMVAQEIDELGISAVGINCGKSIEDNEKALLELSQSTSLPIWFKPNAGLPVLDQSGNPTYIVTPSMMAKSANHWIELGAQFIGGCCGTTPEHIQMISKEIINYRNGQ